MNKLWPSAFYFYLPRSFFGVGEEVGGWGDFILHAHQQVKTARASNLLHPLAGTCACHTSPQTAPSRRASRPRREGKKIIK